MRGMNHIRPTSKYSINDYDDEVLQKINESADLVEYVSQIMELEQRGEEYFTSCPKHIDETPSLSFNPNKNTFYCFSCGRSGGFIGYLMQYEGLTFNEAVSKAAKFANVDLSQMCQSNTFTFLKRLRKMNTYKKKKYVHPTIPASDYTKYSQEKIQEWIDEGISQDVMNLFGVRADNFQNRIVYPVYDMDNHLINIKGRTRYKNYKQLKIPKYINYYSVGVMDYLQGLNITLPYVKQKNEIIIFESIKSVMLAYGWGYKNAASAEKHTLTDEQLNLIAHLHVNVVFAYDSDIDYRSNEVWKSIEKLKRITNVFIIDDKKKLLGGAKTKNAPVDMGKEIWEQLYRQKRKIV